MRVEERGTESERRQKRGRGDRVEGDREAENRGRYRVEETEESEIYRVRGDRKEGVRE